MNEEQLKILLQQIIEKVAVESNQTSTDNSRNCDNVCQGKYSAVVSGETIPDITQYDYTKNLDIPNAANPEEYLRIKAKTDARIGIGRSGPRYTTRSYLRILADHAGAMDAVLNEVPESLAIENNLLSISTVCKSKYEYMTRPDLGRLFSDETKKIISSKCQKNPDVQVIVADGLSSTAVESNIKDLLPSLEQGFKVEGLTSGTPLFVKYCRVPAMDVITEVIKPKVTIILLGERPGLSTYASLSAYITYEGYVGMPEANRTVVSNIHKNGTNPVEAGAHIAGVVKKMIQQKASGTNLQL
ncbi:MAG: ethanolamine ammonia-lyase subunit EutC [Aminipila sp.]